MEVNILKKLKNDIYQRTGFRCAKRVVLSHSSNEKEIKIASDFEPTAEVIVPLEGKTRC